MKNNINLLKLKKIILNNNSGLGIVEFLLAIALFSIIGVVLITLVTQSLRSYKNGQTYADLQNQVLSASTLIEKELRAVTEIVTASDSSLTVRAYGVSSSTAPDQIRYFIENGQIKRGLIPPSGTAPNYTYNPASEQIKIIATNVVSNPLFEYFDQDGNVLVLPATLAEILLVKINLSIDNDPGKPPEAVSTTTKIQLRNLKTNL